MDSMQLRTLVERQRAHFRSGQTLDVAFRRRVLASLRAAISAQQSALLAALKEDLRRPTAEAFVSEIAVVLHEIDTASRHLQRWARPRRIHSPLIVQPASSWISPEPFGSVLVISPWNYPVQLSLSPLVAALAAGNCVVLKPSELAPHTSRVVAQLVASAVEPEIATVVEGGVDAASELLAQRFDHIFYTGSTAVGRVVMHAAAAHLTPVTLELGGKNPCIVDADANIAVAARRIAWGKFVNAGQTCIAPDFVLAHRAVKDTLLAELRKALTAFYGDEPQASPDYARIINIRHFNRLTALLAGCEPATGGQHDASDLYIAPTVLDGVSWAHPAMQDEIFGPILPILTFDDLDTEITRLQARPKPLALYVFSRNQARQRTVLQQLPSGGACINDVLSQWLNLRLPFGGIGESGMGAYHGKAGFDVFSHRRSVLRRGTWLDLGLRYPPYRIPVTMLQRITKYVL